MLELFGCMGRAYYHLEIYIGGGVENLWPSVQFLADGVCRLDDMRSGRLLHVQIHLLRCEILSQERRFFPQELP